MLSIIIMLAKRRQESEQTCVFGHNYVSLAFAPGNTKVKEQKQNPLKAFLVLSSLFLYIHL